MQILKKYFLPILLTPIVCSIVGISVKFLFQIGKYTGVFYRGIYELVLKNV